MSDEQEVTLTDLYVAQERVLESNMRIYDVLLAVVSLLEGSSMTADALRAQHLEGIYYFPPFYVAENTMEPAEETNE